MKIIIAGSRTFDDFALLEKTMDRLTRKLKKVIVLSGTAEGADALGEKWAYSRWHTVMRYHPEWDRHGKKAGAIRNAEMVKDADGLIAFWDGESPGTADVLCKARRKGIKVKIVLFKPQKRRKK